MNQKKAGDFFKELRKEKWLTQEQLAEQMGVTGRTVSRWETGSNMPDLDILIEMADFYMVEIRELIDGERKGENMNSEVKETVLKIAEYSNDEKNIMMQKLHILAWVGVLSFAVSIILNYMGLAEAGTIKNITDICSGISFGMLIIAVIYTSKHISKLKAVKMKLSQHK